MPAKATAPRYDEQFKALVLDALRHNLKDAESPNAAVSATAAQFANHDGGGPSPSTVRNWGETAGIVSPPAKRAKAAAKPAAKTKRSPATAVHADRPAAAEPGNDVPAIFSPTPTTDVSAPESVGLDAVRAEAPAPMLVSSADKDAEIARLRDLVSRSDTDLIARIKDLERELSLLRPLVELYLNKQQPTI
ncbi:hypothetical protein ACIGO9_30265 [Nocardia asteroides]|uniref:hypothetical protein n=1 Tax=Nocardia asteroides TaxID=1824 RepID=UPI0037C6AC54